MFPHKSIPEELEVHHGTTTLRIHKTACKSDPPVLPLLKEILIAQENHEKTRFSYGCAVPM